MTSLHRIKQLLRHMLTRNNRAGPLAGSVLAAGLYKFLKILEYEQANPGQDASTVEPENGNRDGAEEGRIRLVNEES